VRGGSYDAEHSDAERAKRDGFRLPRHARGVVDGGRRSGVLGVSGDGSQGHPRPPDRVQVRKGRSAFAEARRLVFMWAHDLLAECPWMIPALRARFPLNFIDEVRDNSEDQSKILFRLFVEGDIPAIRQRYGDSNQAIHDSPEELGATTDSFPLAAICKTIPKQPPFRERDCRFRRPAGSFSPRARWIWTADRENRI